MFYLAFHDESNFWSLYSWILDVGACWFKRSTGKPASDVYLPGSFAAAQDEEVVAATWQQAKDVMIIGYWYLCVHRKQEELDILDVLATCCTL